MAQKVKHNKMLGVFQRIKESSLEKKAADRKAESKRQEQLGNFSNPKISNLFKKNKGKQQPADENVVIAKDLLKVSQKQQEEIKKLSGSIKNIEKKFAKAESIVKIFQSTVKNDWPSSISFLSKGVPSPDRNYEQLISLKYKLNYYSLLCSNNSQDRHDEIIYSYHISKLLYSFLFNDNLDIDKKRDAIKGVEEYINNQSKYILCESQGLTAFYNIEYHINESSNTIDFGSEVKMYSFIIRDKKSNEILRKALVELP